MATENDLLIPGLPNEIGILCLARVPRAEHLKMSGICRGWWNLLHSREFTDVRRELSLVQEWLYLWSEIGNIWCCYDPSSKKWLKLPAMPEDNRIVHTSGIASVDGKIFVIGGAVSGSDSNVDGYVSCKTVSYFDARSYCWRRAADLNVARGNYCMTGVIGNKIYVSGGLTEGDEITSTAEVYDPVTDTWNLISNMKTPMEANNSVVMGEKLYAIAWDAGSNGIMYNPQTDSWENLTIALRSGWEYETTVLDGKLYTIVDEFAVGNPEGDYDYLIEPAIQVYNPSKDVWEIVEEIWDAGMPAFVMGDVDLVSFCGKLCVVSVETSDLGIIIFMVALEVKESTEGPSCSMTSSDRFLIPLEGELVGQRNKICQVIAL